MDAKTPRHPISPLGELSMNKQSIKLPQIVLTALVAGMIAIYFLWVSQSSQSPRPTSDPQQNSGSQRAEASSIRLQVKKSPVRSTASSPSTGTSNLQDPPWPKSTFTDAELDQNLVAVLRTIQASVLAWTPEVYFDQQRKRRLMSGRDAYTVYAYLRGCMDHPRTIEQFASLENDMAERVDAEELEPVLSHWKKGFLRCEGIGDQRQLILAMVDWLTLAAERGFPQAQIAYYRSLRWLLSMDPWLPYLSADSIRAYRGRANRFLAAAVESGHNEAFAEMALAHVEHIIMDEDLTTAYGYALAAIESSHGSNTRARGLLASIEPALNSAQIKAAGRLTRQICEAHCR